MNVTESQLATALEGFVIGARPLGVTGAGDPMTVQVDNADDFAHALFVTLTRMAALREPSAVHPTGPRLADADLCARCGDQFKPDQVCDACRKFLGERYDLTEPFRAAVTRERLIDALRGARVTITTGGGRVRQGEIAQPHSFASYLYDCLTQPGEPEAREADTDPELAAMAALLPALPLVSALRPDARERVMDWGRRRACDGQPPF